MAAAVAVDSVADLVAAVSEAVAVVDLAVAAMEAVITEAHILAIIIALVSLGLAPAITMAVADALAAFWGL